MQTIQVQTTQHVFIHYPLASVGDRVLAYLLDQLIKIIGAIAVGILLFYADVKNEWVWVLVIGIPFLLYAVLFEMFMNGQTPGKRVLEIQVIRLNGTPASIGDYILRFIFSLIDFGIFSGAIAVIIIIAGGRGQRHAHQIGLHGIKRI